jgi:toxin ParE1/3/4
MNLNYFLTPEADRDLEKIWYYTRETGGVYQANNYLNYLETQFQALLKNPELGKKCDQVRKDYLFLHVKRHQPKHLWAQPLLA